MFKDHINYLLEKSIQDNLLEKKMNSADREELEEQDLSDLPVNQTAIRNLKEIPGDKDKWTMVVFDYLLNIGPMDIDNWKRAAMRGGWQWVNAGAVKKNVLTLTFRKPKKS
jgi:hypothetical protein